MEASGTLQRALKLDNSYLLEFKVDRLEEEEIDKLAGVTLDIKAIKHREKRSLNANDYFHVLCGKIAKELSVSLTEVKNEIIAEWGECQQEEDGSLTHLILKDSIDYKRVEWVHLRPTTKTRVMDNGQLYRVFVVMRGSHTYNTAEMSKLIEGAVSEAKELGIETLTPAELEKLERLWKGAEYGN